LPLKLNDTVPWQSSYEEYVKMLTHAPHDLGGKVPHCAAGPASFIAEATQKGCRVTSYDPQYRCTAKEIVNRVDRTYDTVVTGAMANRDRYVWRKLARRNVWTLPE
jgi:hypothetical protein